MLKGATKLPCIAASSFHVVELFEWTIVLIFVGGKLKKFSVINLNSVNNQFFSESTDFILVKFLLFQLKSSSWKSRNLIRIMKRRIMQSINGVLWCWNNFLLIHTFLQRFSIIFISTLQEKLLNSYKKLLISNIRILEGGNAIIKGPTLPFVLI
jgi:hypothetical protein